MLAVCVAVVVAAAGCKGEAQAHPKAPAGFCRAATRYDDRLQKGAGLDEQIRLVQRMADTAPPVIKADAQTFVEALQRVRTNPSMRNNRHVKAAVDNVNRFAGNACGFYRQRNGLNF